MKKPALHLWIIAAAFMVAFASGGCSKPNQPVLSASEPRITGQPSDPPVDLRINWQVGARYVLRMEMKQASEFRRGSAEEGRGGQQLNLAHEYAVGVTNDPATGLRGLDLELVSLEMEETAGDRTFLNYDSQNRVTGTGGNPAAEQLERLVGGHVRYLVDSSQKIVREEGLNDFMARANAKSKNGGRPGGNKNWTTPVMRQATALEVFKQMLALTALPEQQQFRVGDNWPVQFKSQDSPGGPITITGTNTFRGWQEHDRKKCARVELAAMAMPRRTDRPEERGNRRGMLFNEGSISGVCWIDPAASFPTEVVFEQSFSRTGTLGPQRRQGTNSPPQTFTAQARQTISFKLIDMNLALTSTTSAN